MSVDEKCSAMVTRGIAWHEERGPCGKKAKDRGLCGTHLRSLLQQEAKRTEWDEASRRRDLAVETASALTKQLRVHFKAVGEYVAMDADLAADVLRLRLLAPTLAPAGLGDTQHDHG
jgi:hypothetical protein